MSTSKLSPADLLAQLKQGLLKTEGSTETAAAVAPPQPPQGLVSRLLPSKEPESSLSEEDPSDADSAESTEAGTTLQSNSPSVFIQSGRGGVVKKKPVEIKASSRLSDLFQRVNTLLGDLREDEESYKPKIPDSLATADLTPESVEKLMLKYLLLRGSAMGREISQQIKLPFNLIDPILKQMKKENLVAYKGAAEMGDYVFAITEQGRERARRYLDECSYCGAAPVSLADYLRAMESQSITVQQITEEDLRRAFHDLLVPADLIDKLGPAVNSGRGMFLFGEAGNGKTSIAERVTRAFGDCIWIPRTLGIDGDLIRLFDPGVHEEAPLDEEEGLFDLSGVDPRWVRITRPTIVAGGELTMAELEVTVNPQTKICEAPLQLKSNCGTLVIDDFGRQTMPIDQLLNRWIVPLEKRYDYLNLPSGKKIQVPFDQLIIFSTNLEPNKMVDGAFLRRIPYKIQVPDPSREHFSKLFDIMAPKLGMVLESGVIEYLIETHYLPVKRPFRNCQPRDLLLQVRNMCAFRKLPKRVTRDGIDFAVGNYFSMM